jgi:hypothetical protein
MLPKPIDEIRMIRRELAARFNNNVHRIGEETRRRQRASGRAYITLPKRTPQPQNTTNQSMHPNKSKGSGVFD